MKCCENCFVDRYLKKRIRSDGKIGDCEFCASKSIYTINPFELYENFAELLELYEPVEEGEHYDRGMNKEAIDVGDSLPQAIQDDWGDIFNYDKLDLYNQQCDLLDEIRIGSGHYDYKCPPAPSNELWASKDKSLFHVSEEEQWSGFCQHIKYDRRFILKPKGLTPIADPKDWLPLLLPVLEMPLSAGSIIYRARINPKEGIPKPLEPELMNAPLPNKTRSGRINALGIPVLYTALEKATAISEVCPEKGAYVTVATLHIKSFVRLADLTSVPRIPSPFACEGEKLSTVIRQNALLSCLDHALSIPIRKDDSDIEYVPTQYLAEVIKNANYDGILYASSLFTGGKNIALFEPSVVRIEPNTELFRVTNVSCSFELQK